MVERDLRCVLPVVRRMRHSRSVRVRQLHKLPVIADLQAGGLHFVPGGDHVADKCGKAGDGGKIQHEFIRPQFTPHRHDEQQGIGPAVAQQDHQQVDEPPQKQTAVQPCGPRGILPEQV